MPGQTRAELEQHLRNFVFEGKLAERRNEQSELPQLNQRRLDDFQRSYSDLNRRYQNGLDSIEQQSTGLSAGSAGLGALVAVRGGLPGVIVGAGIGFGGTFYAQYDEIRRRAMLTSGQEAEQQRLYDQVSLYSQQLVNEHRERLADNARFPSLAEHTINTEQLLLTFINDDDFPADLKMPFLSGFATINQERINALNNDQQSLNAAMGRITGLSQASQQQISATQTSLTELGSGLTTLHSQIDALAEGLERPGASIEGLSTEIVAVRGALGRVATQLASQNLRLTDVELVSELVFQELAQVSTHGLEAYDAQIATLRDQYQALLNDPSVTRAQQIAVGNELKAVTQLRLNEVNELKADLNQFFGVTNMVGQLGQLVGSPEIQRAAQMAAAAAQIGIGFAAFAGDVAMQAIAGGPVLGPIAMIAGGVMAIFSAFNQGSGSGLSSALQAISQQLANIQRQIADLGTYIGERFDNIEELLFHQRRLIMKNSRQLVDLLVIFQRNMLQGFIDTQGQIAAVQQIGLQIVGRLTDISNEINQGFAAVYSQDYQRILTQFVNYYDHNRYGQVAALPDAPVRQAMLSVTDWAVNGVKNPIFHGDAAGNYAIDQVLNIPEGEAASHANWLLGILRAQGFTILPAALPHNLSYPIQNQTCTLPNLGTRIVDPIAFASALQAVFKFVERVPEFKPRPADRCQLEHLRLVGEQFLEITLAAKTDARPINYFLDQYQLQINALIKFIYKTLVETLNVRGEDISPELSRVNSALSSLQSADSNTGNLLQQLRQFVANVEASVGEGCNVCLHRWPPVGQGYCVDPSYSHLLARTPHFNDFTDSAVSSCMRAGDDYYGRLAPTMPTNDCHNFDNIQSVVSINQQLSQRVTQYQSGRPSDLSTFSSDLSSGIQWQAGSRQLSINAPFLSRLSSFVDQLSQFATSPLSGLSFTDFFNRFTQQVTSCWVYVRWQCCGTDVDGNDVYRDNRFYVTRNFMSVISGNMSAARSALTNVERSETTFSDAIDVLSPIIGPFTSKVTTANQLNVANLYYLQQPSEQQLNSMLQIVSDWFESRSTASERAQVVQAMIASISNRAQLYQILHQLDIAKKGLALFLEFAFEQEYRSDAIARLAVELMFNSSDVSAALQSYSASASTAPSIIAALRNQTQSVTENVPVLTITTNETGVVANVSVQDVGTQPNTTMRSVAVNVTEDTVTNREIVVIPYRFINNTREYLNDIIASGRNASAAGVLMPAYDWLSARLKKVATFRDNVYPIGLALGDVTAARVLSAARTNETLIINALSTPLLNLTDVRDTSGNSAYLLAVSGCDFNAVIRLFFLGASVNASNHQGDSALNLAVVHCLFSQHRIDMLSLLLMQGVSACRATDDLFNALLQVRSVNRSVAVDRVSCMTLPALATSVTSTTRTSATFTTPTSISTTLTITTTTSTATSSTVTLTITTATATSLTTTRTETTTTPTQTTTTRTVTDTTPTSTTSTQTSETVTGTSTTATETTTTATPTSLTTTRTETTTTPTQTTTTNTATSITATTVTTLTATSVTPTDTVTTPTQTTITSTSTSLTGVSTTLTSTSISTATSTTTNLTTTSTAASGTTVTQTETFTDLRTSIANPTRATSTTTTAQVDGQLEIDTDGGANGIDPQSIEAIIIASLSAAVLCLLGVVIYYCGREAGRQHHRVVDYHDNPVFLVQGGGAFEQPYVSNIDSQRAQAEEEFVRVTNHLTGVGNDNADAGRGVMDEHHNPVFDRDFSGHAGNGGRRSPGGGGHSSSIHVTSSIVMLSIMGILAVTEAINAPYVKSAAVSEDKPRKHATHSDEQTKKEGEYCDEDSSSEVPNGLPAPMSVEPHTHVANYLSHNGWFGGDTAHLIMQPFADPCGNLMLGQVICHVIGKYLIGETTYQGDEKAAQLAPLKRKIKELIKPFHHDQRKARNELGKDLGSLMLHQEQWSSCEYNLNDIKNRYRELRQQDSISKSELADLANDIDRFRRQYTEVATTMAYLKVNSEPELLNQPQGQAYLHAQGMFALNQTRTTANTAEQSSYVYQQLLG